jgi:hypothetical protein
LERSFTSSSRLASPLRKLAVTLSLICMGLVVVDQSIEFVFNRVLQVAPAILPNSITQSQVGVERFWKLLDSGSFPIVFSGSSMMGSALSPQIFDEQVAAQSDSVPNAVNISIAGSRPHLMVNFSKEIILPNHPRLFFYGIEVRALNIDDEPTIPIDSPLGFSLEQDSAFTRAVSLMLARRSGIVRYRNAIHDLVTTGQINNYLSMSNAPGFLASAQQQILRGEDYIYARSQLLFHKPSTVQHTALKEMSLDCRSYNVPCMFIGMPINPEIYKMISPEEWDTYHSELLAIVRDTQIPIWNFDTPTCRVIFDKTRFTNFTHMNLDGVNIFSSIMASLYVEKIEKHAVERATGTDCVEVLTP